MTLVEILIVVVIILVLLGIGLGVGYQLFGAKHVEKTKADMAIIMNAIEDYFDQTGEWPESVDTDSGSGERFELRIPYKSNGSETPVYQRFVSRIQHLDAGTVTMESVEDEAKAVFHFQTSDGQTIQYFADKALGGRPLLIAPGKDGKTRYDDGTDEQQEQWGKDDIRSDK